MGLSTTHDCWQGPYSLFSKWRVHLHHLITGEPETHDSLDTAWRKMRYADDSDPINVLMNHSDCDGIIAHKDCLPLAEALEALIEKSNGNIDEPYTNRWLIKRFADGLRNAHDFGECVEFH